MFSPTLVRDPSDSNDAFLFVNTTTDEAGTPGSDMFIIPEGPGGGTGVYPVSEDSGSPPFVAPVPDAEPQSALLLWTNSNGGGLDCWIPRAYDDTQTLALAANDTTVAVGDSVEFTMTTNMPPLGGCGSIIGKTCVDLNGPSGGYADNDEDVWADRVVLIVHTIHELKWGF